MSVIDRQQLLDGLCMKLRQVGRMQISRILGTVPNTAGRYKAWIDLLERSYFMRAELNALAGLLLEKKVFTEAEWTRKLEGELRFFFEALAKQWPEIEFTTSGFNVIDPQALAARSRSEMWPP
jgi:hypothetical protein